MGRYVLKRFVYMALTLFLITTLTFFLMKLLRVLRLKPGEAITGTKEIILEKYGLNDPYQFNTHVT